MSRPIEKAMSTAAALLLLGAAGLLGARPRPPAGAAEAADAVPATAAADRTGATDAGTDAVERHDAALAGELLGRLNAERIGNGVAPLRVDARLAASAAEQAGAMAGTGGLFHQDLKDELDQGWSRVGENVGFGPNVPAVHRALVASPGHHANLVDPRYGRVGISVHTDDTGRLWVAQVFGG